MSELNFINISERAYKYIRQFTIKSLDDALVELITNSVDAYRKTTYTEKNIFIDIHNNGQIVKVCDRAIGLSSDKMKTCLLQVGNYTAENTSRGFFSRGAKDISAIGDVYFNAIKDDKYSQCVINTDAYGALLIESIDATQEIRDTINIPSPHNGMEVTIKLLPNFYAGNIDQLYSTLCNLAVLRDINTDNHIKLYLRVFDNNKAQMFNKQITYNYPEAMVLLDLEYNVPNYPDVKARLVVKKASLPIHQPRKESEMEFGFIVKDDTTIYEVNTIDDKYRWNPYMNYLYGYLYCTSIKKYLTDFDINGATEKNPYPIIDPSRLSGLNKMHPLIKNLLSIPLVRIDFILRELNGVIASKSVALTDINDLLEELTNMGLDLLKETDVHINFTPSYDQKLLKAIENDRSNYVQAEMTYPMTGNYSVEEIELDNYVKEQILDFSGDSFYVLNNNKELVQINSYAEGEFQDPINILKLINETNPIEMDKYPYLYTINPTTKELIKLYIFQKGFMGDSNLEKNIKVSQKLINITFINDINIPQRYVIDNTNGITIKLNLNNPMIKKYMTNKEIHSLNDVISIAAFSSTQSLLFMKELIIDVLSNLIVNNDIANNKLILDSHNNYNNAQKIMDYRNLIITNVELSIDKAFQKYVDANIYKKIKSLNDNIDTLFTGVMNVFTTEQREINEAGMQLSTDYFRKHLSKLIE